MLKNKDIQKILDQEKEKTKDIDVRETMRRVNLSETLKTRWSFLSDKEKEAHKQRTRDAWVKNPNRKSIAKKVAMDPSFSQKCKKGIAKKAEDPEYAKKRSERLKNLWADPKIRKKRLATNKKYWTKCQVKEPGKPWKTFDSVRDVEKYYQWNGMAQQPAYYFPKDGSIKTIGKFGPKGKKRTGWQLRRIIDQTI